MNPALLDKLAEVFAEAAVKAALAQALQAANGGDLTITCPANEIANDPLPDVAQSANPPHSPE